MIINGSELWVALILPKRDARLASESAVEIQEEKTDRLYYRLRNTSTGTENKFDSA